MNEAGPVGGRMATSRIAALLAGRLGSRASGGTPTVAIPMANNPEVLGCIRVAVETGLARFTLIGPRDEVSRLAHDHGVDPDAATLVHETDPVRACARAATMAATGEAQVLMKGLVQTADFVRSILNRSLGLAPPGGLLSHVALCDVDGFDRLFLVTDAAITTYPNTTQKRTIVLNALACSTALGMERPRIAMVAPVEKVSDKVVSTKEAAEVVAGFVGDSRFDIDGPFGLDVAISVDAAATKGVSGPVAGAANVLVMPNIDAANVLYKAITGFAHARTAGIVAGAVVPVVLTSRSDSEDSKLNSLRFALAAARAT